MITNWGNRLFTLLYCLLVGCALAAQPDSELFQCKDVVKLRGNNQYTGTITKIDSVGNLTITTWSGFVVAVPASTVLSVEQICVPRGQPGKRQRDRPPFRESGAYIYSRLGMNLGESGAGLMLQHSIGYRFSHWCHAGIGAGIESFSFDEPEVYPLFAEVRSFLTPGRISPFVGAGLGWGFMSKKAVDFGWGETSNWKGGMVAHVQACYRIGNHFVVYTGLRFQQQERSWVQPWGNFRGVDKILRQRMEIGIGLYL